jgi:hypothetical protein
MARRHQREEGYDALDEVATLHLGQTRSDVCFDNDSVGKTKFPPHSTAVTTLSPSDAQHTSSNTILCAVVPVDIIVSMNVDIESEPSASTRPPSTVCDDLSDERFRVDDEPASE